MEAKDLSVNNLIDYNGFTAKVLSVNAYSNPSVKIQFTSYDGFIYIQEEYLNYQPIVKPIPLTEEWLIKFGWSQHKRELGGFTYVKSTSIENGNFLLKIDDFLSGSYIPREGVRTLKYVHELQNWWYANTAEELTINE